MYYLSCFKMRPIQMVIIPIFLISIFSLVLSSKIRTQDPILPEVLLNGTVEISTDANRMWSYISIAEQPGSSLRSAFTVQYQNPIVHSLEWLGTGRVNLGKDYLLVTAAEGDILFKFPSYSGPVRAGQPAYDVIGIAAYSWSGAASETQPVSHRQFADRITSRNKPGTCIYSQCHSGGEGAQGCGCGGIQVSCHAPYEACCANTRAYCCSPAK